MEQWRISLKNSKGRRGLERDVEVEELVHLPAGGHQSKQQHLWGGWTPSLQFFSSQRGGALALLRGGLGLSMEGLEGGGGAEEARKGGTEAFGQLDSKVKVLSLSCARIFCSFCNCDQCLKRARLSWKYSPWKFKSNSEIKPLIAVQRNRYWSWNAVQNI